MLRLRNQGVHFSALVAGDGPDFLWLSQFIERHGMREKVRLLGTVSIERMQELMAAADIFFLPSQWEGIALSIYEAMACGLPIVGAAVGGQRELVTPDCGVLISRSDEETEASHYAEILAELLCQPRRRVRMGTAGRVRVSNYFQLEQMGKKMAGLLNEARSIHDSRGSTALSLDEGRARAAGALKYVGLSQAAEQLRNEGVSGREILAVLKTLHWRAGAYAMFRWLYEPFYRHGVKRGGAWYFPVVEKVKRMLLGAS
jgi:hypothetical protein